MEDNEKTLYVKTADGSVWEVIRETKKEYEIRSRWRMFIDKRLIVAKFYKEKKK